MAILRPVGAALRSGGLDRPSYHGGVPAGRCARERKNEVRGDARVSASGRAIGGGATAAGPRDLRRLWLLARPDPAQTGATWLVHLSALQLGRRTQRRAVKTRWSSGLHHGEVRRRR